MPRKSGRCLQRKIKVPRSLAVCLSASFLFLALPAVFFFFLRFLPSFCFFCLILAFFYVYAPNSLRRIMNQRNRRAFSSTRGRSFARCVQIERDTLLFCGYRSNCLRNIDYCLDYFHFILFSYSFKVLLSLKYYFLVSIFLLSLPFQTMSISICICCLY